MTSSVSAAAAGAPSNVSHAQQQAQLDQLLRKYGQAQRAGQSPSALKALGKQIQAAAKALGETVNLPQNSVSPSPVPTSTTQAAPSNVSGSTARPSSTGESAGAAGAGRLDKIA